MIKVLVISLVIIAAVFQHAFAQPLNFQQASAIEDVTEEGLRLVNIRCHRPGESDVRCGMAPGWTNGDTGGNTPFLMEVFRAEDGRRYFHVSIGHPEYGFAQDTYIQVGRTSGGINNARPGEWSGMPLSASLGDSSCHPTNGGGGFATSNCNASDPLGENRGNDFGGSGSANPRAVRMRQIIGGTWDETSKTWSCEQSDANCQEFLKSERELKPVLTHLVRDHDQGLEALWHFDMSNSDYATDTVAGVMINIVKMDGVNGAAFDYENGVFDQKESELTGGRYRFVGTWNGIGENASTEPYEYFGESNFKLDQEWSNFVDPDQASYNSGTCHPSICPEQTFD